VEEEEEEVQHFPERQKVEEKAQKVEEKLRLRILHYPTLALL
jgi:hypothetical protein